jgi:mRNA interferase HicA
MKRKDLIRELLESGCILYRFGAKHDIYFNPKNGNKQPVPRHIEIDNALANHIKKYLGIKKDK